MTKEEIIQFWINGSEENLGTMHRLFDSKDYDWALFLGHLSIEKLLKAFYVKVKNEQIPHIHDLNRIAYLAELKLSESDKDFLDIVTSFNIRVRYADYKLNFHKKCTKEYSEKYIKKIEEFRLWLKGIF